LGVPGFALLQEQPGGLGEIRELARLVAHEILRRRAGEQHGAKLSGMSAAQPLRMVPACSISRRAARSSSLPNCGWTFMLFSPAGSRFSSRLSPIARRRRGERLRDRFASPPETRTLRHQQVAGGARRGEKASKSNVLPIRRKAARPPGQAAPPARACHARMTRV
jgi:hypothetical protein